MSELRQAIQDYIDNLRGDTLVNLSEHVHNQATAKKLERILELYPDE
jgi:predicted transcriptional regulator